MIVLAIIVIITAIAIPTYVTLLPNYRLKRAAHDLHSSLLEAKMEAIKTRNPDKDKVIFDISGGQYEKPDGTVINLNDAYKGSVSYGRPDSGSNITYTPQPEVTFNARGMTDNDTKGYVFLKNNKGKYYRVGTYPSGVIILEKWNGSDWK